MARKDQRGNTIMLFLLRILASFLLLGLQLRGSEGTASQRHHHVLKGSNRSLYFDGVPPGATPQGTYYKSLPLESESLEEVTIQAWVKIERHKRYNWLAGTVNRESGWALFVDEAEKACFGLFRDKQLKTISTRSLQLPKAWHFVSGVFKNGTIQVFVDAQPGEVVPLSLRSLSKGVWDEGLYLGGSPAFPPLRLHGELGNVQLWDTARSSEQIAMDMMADYSQSCGRSKSAEEGNGKRDKGLVALWSMDGERERSADRIKETVKGQNFEMKGLGAEPMWRHSTRPIYLPAGSVPCGVNENENQQPQFTARISAEKHSSLSFTIDKMKSKLKWEAYVEKETMNETLGKVPDLPWPIMPNRSIRFSLRYDQSEEEEKYVEDMSRKNKDICTQLKIGVIENSAYLASQTVYLVLMDPTKPTTHSEIVDLCHFAGRDQSLVRLNEDTSRRVRAIDVSLLFFLLQSDLRSSLDRIGGFATSFPKSLSLECFVFRIEGEESSSSSLTHEIKRLKSSHGIQQQCSIYTVRSVEEALRIAQAVARGERTMVSTMKSPQMLPSVDCSETLELALEESRSKHGGQGMFSLIPNQGAGDAMACSSSSSDSTENENGTDTDTDSTEGVNRCERMDQRAFAGTIVSALGGLPKWWALFVPNAVTFINTDLLKSLWIEDLPKNDVLAVNGGGFGHLSGDVKMKYGIWRMYIRMLQSHHAWDESSYDDGQKGLSYTHYVYRNTDEHHDLVVADQRQPLELSELLLVLQKILA